jgi:tRNA 2-thiouridine synthesizing protein C
MKHIVFLIRTAPYGSAAIAESARTCLGLAAMGFEISYVLTDDAAWTLLPNHAPEAIGGNNVRELVANLADLGVKLYVEDTALAERSVPAVDAGLEVWAVSAAEIADLIARADAVLTY